LATIEITNAIPESAVSPRDCALLNAAPLDRESFLADLNNSGKELARHVASELGNLPEDASWRLYEPHAQLGLEVCERAGKMDATVIQTATLADFHRVALIMPVTALFAHWRGARFKADDIVDPAAAIEYLRLRGHAGLGTNQSLADALNSVIDEIRNDEEIVDGTRGGAVASEYSDLEARLRLDRELGGAVRGGAAVEFAAGFQPIAEIVAGLPVDLSGILDLTVCRSVVLGEEIKRRCRDCIVHKNAGSTSMSFRFGVFAQVLEVLRSEPQPYTDAVYKVRNGLIGKYGKRKK